MYAGVRYLISITLVILFILAFTRIEIVSTSKYIIDVLGREVTIPSPIDKVVVLSPSITEIMFSLNLQNKIVGVDSYSYNDTFLNINKYFQSKGVAIVGGYWWSTISIEKILSLQPDLVLADAGAHRPLLNSFTEYNVTVIYLNGGSASSIQDIYEDVEIISKIFDVDEDVVVNTVNGIEEKIYKAKQILEPLEGKRVLTIVGFYNGIWVAGKSTFIDDLLSRLGLVNVASTIGWKPVNIETIVSWKPEIILITSGMGITEDVIRETGLLEINAGIILLDKTITDLIVRPGPLIGLAAEELAKKLVEELNIVETKSKPSSSSIIGTTALIQYTTVYSTSTVYKRVTITETATSTIERTSYTYNKEDTLGSLGNVIVTAIIALVVGLTIGLMVRRREK